LEDNLVLQYSTWDVHLGTVPPLAITRKQQLVCENNLLDKARKKILRHGIILTRNWQKTTALDVILLKVFRTLKTE
jgi:hypothetical protein